MNFFLVPLKDNYCVCVKNKYFMNNNHVLTDVIQPDDVM